MLLMFLFPSVYKCSLIVIKYLRMCTNNTITFIKTHTVWVQSAPDIPVEVLTTLLFTRTCWSVSVITVLLCPSSLFHHFESLIREKRVISLQPMQPHTHSCQTGNLGGRRQEITDRTHQRVPLCGTGDSSHPVTLNSTQILRKRETETHFKPAALALPVIKTQ